MKTYILIPAPDSIYSECAAIIKTSEEAEPRFFTTHDDASNFSSILRANGYQRLYTWSTS